LGLGLPARAEAPGDLIAAVRVDGMVCYSCSYGLEKNCKIKGLGKGYTMDLKNGLFKVRLSAEEAVPEPQAIAKIINDAGFTYRGVTLELEGKVVKQNGGYAVILPKNGQTIAMAAGPALAPKLDKKINKIVKVRLQAEEDGNDWTLAALQV